MIDLQQAVEQTGATELSSVDFQSAAWQLFESSNAELFARVQQANPDTHITKHLLGLLTKVHIETLSRVQAHQTSTRGMKQALDQELGSTYAKNFRYQDGEQLIFITHLWVYLQGHLAMDFSLANDHAENTANTLVSIQGGDAQRLRSDFMESYYLAKEKNTAQTKPNDFLSWLKSLFD